MGSRNGSYRVFCTGNDADQIDLSETAEMAAVLPVLVLCWEKS